jgi:hypothetical protein
MTMSDMTELQERVKMLNGFILSGDTIKAMETFYSEDIEMQENEEIPRRGKRVCIDAERSNLEKVKTISGILLNQALDENKNVVFSEWEFVVTYRDNTKCKLKEVSVQYWFDGLVTKEKFYYKGFSEMM